MKRTNIARVNKRLTERVEKLENLLGLQTVVPNHFGLTDSESDLFQLMMDREIAGHTEMLVALYGKSGSEHKSKEMLTTFVTHIRKKLAKFGVQVKSIYGKGYSIPLESKAKIRSIVA